MSNPRSSALDTRPPENPLAWLLPFRWAVAGCELAVMAAAGPFGGPAIAWWGWAVPALQAASSLAAGLLAARGIDRSRLAGLLLVLDAALLTVLFAASGGSTNPFTIFYLVLIVFSALVLRPVWSWVTALASVTGFSLLFALPAGETAHADRGAFSWHLRGMWAAFAAAALATALFVTLLRHGRDRREQELARLRDLANRYDRLAALSIFAAGAAHELATPLGTVALAAERLAAGKADRDTAFSGTPPRSARRSGAAGACSTSSPAALARRPAKPRAASRRRVSSSARSGGSAGTSADGW